MWQSETRLNTLTKKPIYKRGTLYKERFANFFKRRVDLSGNIGRNFYLMKKNLENFALLKGDSRYLMSHQRILNASILNYFLLERLGKTLNITRKYNFLQDINKIISIFKLKKQILINKFTHFITTYTSKRLRPALKKNVQNNFIHFSPFMRFPLPGYPHFRAYRRIKLKKKLLIKRLRNKSKFLMMQQSIALHSFMGTKELSYSSLVKNNKLGVLSILYLYKLKRRQKLRMNYKERKFLKRPFKLSRMNQARFHATDIPFYCLFYDKMKQEMEYVHNNKKQMIEVS